ncbi:Afadin- and alpha-actinin-binding protein A [Lamellibrachia satsuma]|nr:Afadin- and alpha-actinin-binding protein A [Lamellibrachia satsuma]
MAMDSDAASVASANATRQLQFFRMAGWGSLAETDFLTRYMSQSCTPLYRISSTKLQFSPSPTGGTVQSYENTASMTEFCGEHNVEDCLAYLNNEVTTLGMSPLYDSRAVTFDVVRLVNCVHDLLQKHQNSARIREELENRQHRTDADMMRLQLMHERLKESLRQYERELMQQQEKDRQLTNKNKLLSTKLKAEKDEVRRLQSVMQHRDVQYQHERRKCDREMTRQKERLHQLLLDKTERKIGIEISNSLQRSDGKRGLWRTGTRDQEEMYRLVISNYEEKQKELMEENSDLRQCLSDMQKELHALLCMRTSRIRTNSESRADGDSSNWSDPDSMPVRPIEEMSDGHFQMPYEFVRDNIEKSLKEKCRLLRLYIRNIEKQTVTVASKSPTRRDPSTSAKSPNDEKHNRETEKLNKQISRYREIIEQQEILIQQTLQPTPPTEAELSGDGNNFMIESETDFLEAAKKFFSEQKLNFEDERKKFTEAAIRLGREKKAFEEEKASFLKEQFFKLSPFKDHSHETSCTTPEVIRGKRLLPSTPSYQEAPPPRHLNFSTPVSLSRPHSSPSTADLYRALGLTSNSSLKERRELPKLHRESTSLPHMSQEKCSSPASVTTVTTSNSTSPMSNMSAHRLAEHVDNVKLALLQKHNQDGDPN